MMLYFLIYVLTVVATFIFCVGYKHAYETNAYLYLNNRPRWGLEAFMSLMGPCNAFAIFIVYRGFGWVWPKKGVTYD